MNSAALQKLTIQHLRGSAGTFTLSFEKGKKLTVIYGENGAGKSTICDALDFLGKGRVGSLENRGLGRTSRYWHSLGKKPSDVAVTLETAAATCRGAIHKEDVVVLPAEHRPRVEVLRRAQILSLIEAKPGERYVAIKRFIDVSGIESSEAFLRQAIKEIEGRQEVAIARVQENRDAIQQFWEEAGKPGLEPLAWAEREARRDIEGFDAEVAALRRLSVAYDRLTDYPAQLAAAEENLGTVQALLASAQHALDDSILSASLEDGEVLGVLEAARHFFAHIKEPRTCPLCESAEKVAHLPQRVEERLAALTSIQRAHANQRAKEQEVQRATQRVDDSRASAENGAAGFEECLRSTQWPSDIPLPQTAIPRSPSKWSDWLANHAHLPEQWHDAETARQDKKQFLSTLRRALNTYTENVLAQKELDYLLPAMTRALNIVEGARHRFTDETLAIIAADVGRLYEAVHPGEGLNKISLQLDSTKRASLKIETTFGGQASTPPQAYFSDSHLDTLGLCVFLALAKLEAPADTILGS